MLYNKKHQCISTTASGLHVFTCKDQWHPPSRSKRSTIFLDAFSELPRSNKLRSIEGKGGKVENETKKHKAEEGFSNSGRPICLWRNIAHGVSTLSELPKHSWRKHPWTVGGNSPEQARSDGYSPEPPAEAASSSHRIYWWIVLRPKRFRFRGNNLLCIPTSESEVEAAAEAAKRVSISTSLVWTLAPQWDFIHRRSFAGFHGRCPLLAHDSQT